MGNKITSKEMPICVNCIHAYVCEEYNINRDMLRKRCAYHNDHFLDIEQHDTKLRKETAKEFATTLISVIWEEEKDEKIRIKDVHGVIRDILNSEYGVEVED